MEWIAFLLVAVLVLLVIFMSKVSNLTGKFSDLDWELKKLRGRVEDLEQGSPAGGRTEKGPIPSARQTAPQSVKPAPSAVPRVEPVAAPRTAELFPPAERKPSRTREEWESLIGGKVLNRIGALALIIGIGFF